MSAPPLPAPSAAPDASLQPASSLSVDQARAALLTAVRPVSTARRLPAGQALGRVLAEDIVSPIDVPAHDNSAMDGYALHWADLPDAGRSEARLAVAGTVLAGRPWNGGSLAPGQCLRIMTGAVLPAGLDTVVPQEMVRQAEDGSVLLPPGAAQPQAHVRRCGEDLARGQVALAAGHRLRPADLGLVASLGLAQVRVLRRLRVAVFSTGDELRAPGEELASGCIYDSNRATLLACLQGLGVEAIDLGLVPDDPETLAHTLQRACTRADAVLTSGGVSVGDADHTRAVLARQGEVAFWQVDMRPGRPFAFGALRRASDLPQAAASQPVWLFALPGNPVASLVSFLALVRPALARLAGERGDLQPLMLQARCAQPLKKRPGRTEFQRGRLQRDAATGDWLVSPHGQQGSALLHGMSQAQVLIVLPPESGPVAAGSLVEVWPLEGLF